MHDAALLRSITRTNQSDNAVVGTTKKCRRPRSSVAIRLPRYPEPDQTVELIFLSPN